MGAGYRWALWACAHPENYLGGHCPPSLEIVWLRSAHPGFLQKQYCIMIIKQLLVYI